MPSMMLYKFHLESFGFKPDEAKSKRFISQKTENIEF